MTAILMTILIYIYIGIAIAAFLAGVFGADRNWRKQPANVLEKELRVLEMLWWHRQMSVDDLVFFTAKTGPEEMRVLLGSLHERGLVTQFPADPPGGSFYSLTTEGIQICALNKRLRERAA